MIQDSNSSTVTVALNLYDIYNVESFGLHLLTGNHDSGQLLQLEPFAMEITLVLTGKCLKSFVDISFTK